MEGEQYAAKQALDVVGFYHSHPDHPAVPSAYDLQHAWPLYSYIVVAVGGGVGGAVRWGGGVAGRAQFNEEVKK